MKNKKEDECKGVWNIAHLWSTHLTYTRPQIQFQAPCMHTKKVAET